MALDQLGVRVAVGLCLWIGCRVVVALQEKDGVEESSFVYLLCSEEIFSVME